MDNRVLIVDDDYSIREVLSELIRILLLKSVSKYQVDSVSTGEEAVSYCSRHNPKLIIMDLHMPGIDGLEAFYLIKKASSQMVPKTVFLTGFGSSSEIQKQLNEAVTTGGASAWYSKPVSKDCIQAILDEHLEG